MTAIATHHDDPALIADDLDPLTVLPGDDEDVVCDLDAAPPPSDRPKPFVFRHAGRRWRLLDQVFTDWQEVDLAQGRPRAMMHALLPTDQREPLLALRMEIWQLQKLIADYRTHYGLDPDDDGVLSQ